MAKAKTKSKTKPKPKSKPRAKKASAGTTKTKKTAAGGTARKGVFGGMAQGLAWLGAKVRGAVGSAGKPKKKGKAAKAKARPRKAKAAASKAAILGAALAESADQPGASTFRSSPSVRTRAAPPAASTTASRLPA